MAQSKPSDRFPEKKRCHCFIARPACGLLSVCKRRRSARSRWSRRATGRRPERVKNPSCYVWGVVKNMDPFRSWCRLVPPFNGDTKRACFRQAFVYLVFLNLELARTEKLALGSFFWFPDSDCEGFWSGPCCSRPVGSRFSALLAEASAEPWCYSVAQSPEGSHTVQ